MAETLAVVSSILQILDFGSKIAHRLREFYDSRNQVPRSFQEIKNTLPALTDVLKRIAEDDCFNKDTPEAILDVVKDCQLQVEQLDIVLEEALPAEGDPLWRIGKKALSSIRQEKKMQQITKTIQNYIQILALHQATGSPRGAHQTPLQREFANVYAKGVDRTNVADARRDGVANASEFCLHENMATDMNLYGDVSRK